jgi:hypothetical protein
MTRIAPTSDTSMWASKSFNVSKSVHMSTGDVDSEVLEQSVRCWKVPKCSILAPVMDAESAESVSRGRNYSFCFQLHVTLHFPTSLTMSCSDPSSPPSSPEHVTQAFNTDMIESDGSARAPSSSGVSMTGRTMKNRKTTFWVWNHFLRSDNGSVKCTHC